MQRPRLRFGLRSAVGPDARQALISLFLNSTTSLLAGAFLGSITGTLSKFPGLLVLVPAAIGMRGNIFGSFGNRISTTIHAGTFTLSTRRDTILGQNVLATGILTLGISLVAAIVAKAIAVGLGVEGSIPVLDLITIAIIGGLLGSVVVLAATLALTSGAVRYGWDLDNVTAPLVSTLGDVLTLPALWLATFAIGVAVVSTGLGAVLAAAAVGALIWGLRTSLPELRRIVRESVPVLAVAALLSAMAGAALERSFSDFDAFPALLVLLPAFVSSAGALGGLLSGRLSTKLFLGLLDPEPFPGRAARSDIGFAYLLFLPVYAFNGVGAHYVALALGQRSPGVMSMAALALIGGALAMLFVVAVAYYGTVVAFRTGVDPDTYGIPVVSSSVDFVGAVILIVTIAALGIV
ncbi:MAG: magnesium transporter [Actinomycetota bacterium]|nr:magnesium transporter [Acidimicrobiia bacterium]MDQ3293605.1 magnesium transporter [Actinomycetota bacterium]